MNNSVEHYEQQALQSLRDGSGPQTALAVAVLALAGAVERVARAIESMPGRPITPSDDQVAISPDSAEGPL